MTDFDKSNTRAGIVVRLRNLIQKPFLLAAASSLTLLGTFCCCGLLPWITGFQKLEGPAAANEAAALITDWTLPERFAGQQGLLMDNFLIQSEIAVFRDKQGRGNLAIAQLHRKWGPLAEKSEFAEQLFEMIIPELKKIDDSQKETLKPTIREKPAEFEISQGEDRASTTRYRQVTGTFQGKRDKVLLILQIEEDFMTDADITAFIESIH